MNRECRGLRFSFDATAEIAPEGSPKATIPGRVTELSLMGCFVEPSASFEPKSGVLLRIYEDRESFETEAIILYIRPFGVGLVFRAIKPRYREILQNWIFTALDRQLHANKLLR